MPTKEKKKIGKEKVDDANLLFSWQVNLYWPSNQKRKNQGQDKS